MVGRMATATGAVAGGVAAITGVLASVTTYGQVDPSWIWIPVLVVGPSFTIAGVVARLRRPDYGIGWLMLAMGIVWCAVDLRWSTEPVLFGIGFSLFYLGPVAVFTHLVLALPTGRLATWPGRLVALGVYLNVLLTQPMRYFVEHPRPPQSWASPVKASSAWASAASVAGLVLTFAAIWLVISRWRAAGRPARRVHAVTWITGAAVGCIVTASTAVSVLNEGAAVLRPFELVYALALIFTPFAILAGVLRVRMARMRVAELVIRLSQTAEPRAVCRALAEALGDPTLQVCFRLPGSAGYADADGNRVLLPAASQPPGSPLRSARAVTLVARSEEPLAVLVHDPELTGQRPLVEAVVAAALLALENGRLHAAQRAQLAEVRASRTRIVAAADLERQRIQRDLHDGIQNKLLTAAVLVGQEAGGAPSHPLGQAAAQLREAITELREITEGIHPPSLTAHGLAAVVETLAERAPIPVRFQVPASRWPAAIERTAYFVISEALANIYKHAAATHATVLITVSGARVQVEITDDGRGGAQPGNGTGLRGLDDRVAAIGGTLRIASSTRHGTRITAELPCA